MRLFETRSLPAAAPWPPRVRVARAPAIAEPDPCLSQSRAPKDHVNTTILKNMISGIPLMLRLETRM